MGRERAYGPRDEEDKPVGDSGFMGVNDHGDPRQLEEGVCVGATNKSFENGAAETRKAFMTPTWGGVPGINFDVNYDGVEEGISFPVDFEVAGFGPVFGSCVFSDPNGQEAVLIAVRNGVWRVRCWSEAELIRLPEKVAITGAVRFAQVFDKVLMFRGAESVLEWDPQGDFTTGIGEFEEITAVGSGSGTFVQPLPAMDDGVAFANRLWGKLNGYRDQIVASDILDYTHCDPALSQLRVNAGTDDAIVRTLPYAGRKLVVLKRRSGYELDGVWGDTIETTLTCDQLSGCMGCVGRDAAAQMGKEIVYLGDGNVWTVGQTEQGKLQAGSTPLSGPIQGIMRRIHWAYAGGAKMQVHQERLLLAVPLDGATYNNAVVVYNFTTKFWEGIWTAPWMRVVEFLVVTENEESKLAFINGVGGKLRLHWWYEVSEADRLTLGQANAQIDVQGLTDGALCVMGAGKMDFVYGYTSWIQDEILTRGYNLGPIQQVRSLVVTLDNETWNPRFDVFVRGGNLRGEERVASEVRRGFEREVEGVEDETVVEGAGAVVVSDGYAQTGLVVSEEQGS